MALQRSKASPREQRILDVLADGYRHTKDELHRCLDDELSDISAIKKPISNLRTVLQPRGMTIVCEFHSRRIYYRLVRLVNLNAE